MLLILSSVISDCPSFQLFFHYKSPSQIKQRLNYSSFFSPLFILNQEELKRAHAVEREKRAAAAERRIAEAAAAARDAQGSSTTEGSTTSQSKSGVAGDISCSCCNTSLAGKVPFHRYNYKYCSTSCMHVHREILEDG